MPLLVLTSFILKLCLDIPLMIIGYIVFGIAYFWRTEGANKEEGTHLPKWADWCWGNRDHGIYGGTFYTEITKGWTWLPDGIYWFVRAYAWSVIRNPTFNWSKYIIGVQATGKQVVIGEALTARDRIDGWYICYDLFTWDVHVVIQYAKYPHKCFHFRAGWKINRKDKGEYAQHVFLIAPWKDYTGV